MKSIDGRISKLERRFGISDDKPRFVVILDGAGTRALSDDRCIQILDEAGLLHTGGVGVVDLTQIPNGLSAKETEMFLRESGAQLSGSRGVGGPDMQVGARTSPPSAVPVVFNVQMDHWKEQLATGRLGNEEVR